MNALCICSSRVFLLGPSHHYYTPKCALSRATVYKTPIGDLPIDMEGTQELISACTFISFFYLFLFDRYAFALSLITAAKNDVIIEYIGCICLVVWVDLAKHDFSVWYLILEFPFMWLIHTIIHFQIKFFICFNTFVNQHHNHVFMRKSNSSAPHPHPHSILYFVLSMSNSSKVIIKGWYRACFNSHWGVESYWEVWIYGPSCWWGWAQHGNALALSC